MTELPRYLQRPKISFDENPPCGEQLTAVNNCSPSVGQTKHIYVNIFMFIGQARLQRSDRNQ